MISKICTNLFVLIVTSLCHLFTVFQIFYIGTINQSSALFPTRTLIFSHSVHPSYVQKTKPANILPVFRISAFLMQMPILIGTYLFLIICSVLGFDNDFMIMVFGVSSFMDCIKIFNPLSIDEKCKCWFFIFGSFQQVLASLILYMFFKFMLELLNSDWFSSFFARFLRDLRNGFVSDIVLEGKSEQQFRFLKEDSYKPLIGKTKRRVKQGSISACSDGMYDADNEADDRCDVSSMKKLLKNEQVRANEAFAELEKERAASVTAAEEAMAMILRLQRDKGFVEMELAQYRRVMEEKQIHDQKVIQSLKSLIWRHKSGRGDKLISSDEMRNPFSANKECEYRDEVWNSLENVLYSSRDVAGSF